MRYNTYDEWVASLRPAKRSRSLNEPVATWIEREMLPGGRAGKVGAVIINNRECPYRCVMCGLWQDTADHTPEPGQVAAQIARALERLGEIDAVKLYNAGSFFDDDAMPARDRAQIADACRDVDWVIVESRPDLIDERAAEFAGRLRGGLEVAIGLETVDPTILALLNKRMTLRDYERGTRFLLDHGIAHRAFAMVKPPWTNESRGLELGRASIDYAAQCGATTVSLIPTYVTPGAMEALHEAGFARPVSPWSLYRLARHALDRGGVQVLVDTWSLQHTAHCGACVERFRAAFQTLNASQELPAVACRCETHYEELLASETVRDARAYREWLRSQLAGRSSVRQAIR